MKFGEIPEELKLKSKDGKWGSKGGKWIEKEGELVPREVLGDPNKFAGTSEHSQQVALFAAVAQYRDSVRGLDLFHAIPNGGTRGGDKRSAMIAGANMKAEGAKKGVSDTFLPVARCGYHGFYIEMKKPGNLKGESAEQKEWGARVSEEGYLYAVFDSWHVAFRALMWYLGFEHTRAWRLPD